MAEQGVSAPEVVVRAVDLRKTFVTGFVPISFLARHAEGQVRPELDHQVLPRQVDAVRGLNLEVRRGEIFGLLGPNGSGKTTSIKMMMGLIFPTAGTIEVLGRSVGDVAVKARVGYLPENPAFYEYLRADELLDLSARLCGVDRTTRRRRIPELLDRVGLASALNRPLRKFSKGMLQRIGLAQAVIHDPDLVVLDEPLSGLDPLGRKEVRDLIGTLRDQGKTVIFSSHILSDVEMICDRVGILIQGALRDVGPIDALVSARTTETEVLLEGDAAEPVLALARDRGWDPLSHGDRLRVTLPGKQDPAELLTAALHAGLRVISVSPRSESLEDLFVREAGRSGPSEEAPKAPSSPESTSSERDAASEADASDEAGAGSKAGE